MSTDSLLLMLRSEQEILALCLERIPYIKIERQEYVKQLIESTIDKIQNELKTIETENNIDKLDLCKLRINRILIQNEKIFNSNEHFKEILKRVPRIYNNQYSEFENEKQKEKEKEQQSILKANFTLGQQSDRIKNSPNNESKSPQNYRSTQQKLSQIRFQLDFLQKEVATHEHQDQKQMLRQIQEDNARIIADYHLLKNDNTELFHICNELQKQIFQIEEQNNYLEHELEGLKKRDVLNNSNSQQQSRYLIKDNSKLVNDFLYFLEWSQGSRREATSGRKRQGITTNE